MKKQLTVALGLAVLATPAFATKARLQALGEDIYGSFYINDNRNIWYNAAHINNHKDLVTFEWGQAVNTAGGNQDTTTNPRAEGGVFKSAGNLVYGVQFGSASNTSNALRTAAVGAANGGEVNEENNIDVFVGGDAGLKWGANLGYSSSADDESNGDANQESLRTRLGVIAGDIEGYANINLVNKAESAAGAEFEGDLGYQVGAIYNFNDYRIFADWRSFEGEADTGPTTDLKLQQLQVGAGRATKLNDKATLFTKAMFFHAKAENEAGGNFSAAAGGCSSAAALACEEYTTTRVPVVVGLEYDATSWLVLRASVAQSVWGKEEDKDDKRGLAETTAVNAGATLKFGELSVDGVIGNSTGAAAGVAGDNTASGTGTLRSDVLMTRVGMTYRF